MNANDWMKYSICVKVDTEMESLYSCSAFASIQNQNVKKQKSDFHCVVGRGLWCHAGEADAPARHPQLRPLT